MPTTNLNFVTTQLTHLEPTVYAKKYEALVYQGLVFVDTSASEYTDVIKSRMSDVHGDLALASEQGKDFNRISISASSRSLPVFMRDGAISWGNFEIAQAMQMGVNLSSDSMAAFRMQAERGLDTTVLTGIDGGTGLINDAGIATAAGTLWTTNSDNMIADIFDLLSSISEGTNNIEVANTLLVSPAQFNKMARTLVSGTTTSVLNVIRTNNPYTNITGLPLTIKSISRLTGAGAGGVDRTVAYSNDGEAVKLHVPMGVKFDAPVTTAGGVEVVGRIRHTALDIRTPEAFKYVDGL